MNKPKGEQSRVEVLPVPAGSPVDTGIALQPNVAMGTVRALTPTDLVESAAKVATVLARIIEEKELYKAIPKPGGKPSKHVFVEGWTTCAALMGCMPREKATVEQDDGSFVSQVELVRMSDGAVLSQASASCGDSTDGEGSYSWARRKKFQKRSMAQTRAVSKVCRLAFSWIMVLAGYEATPAEEMDRETPGRDAKPERREAAERGAWGSTDPENRPRETKPEKRETKRPKQGTKAASRETKAPPVETESREGGEGPAERAANGWRPTKVWCQYIVALFQHESWGSNGPTQFIKAQTFLDEHPDAKSWYETIKTIRSSIEKRTKGKGIIPPIPHEIASWAIEQLNEE